MDSSLTVNFNGQLYTAIYNAQTGYYEVELNAPEIGGIYTADIDYTDFMGNFFEDSQVIQIFAKEPIKFLSDRVFMWIFDKKTFNLKDIVELSYFDINIDEETNANTIIDILKKTSAVAKDIVVIKRNNENIFWGIVDNIQNTDGQILYEFTLKYLTNLFNQNIILNNEELIKTTGIEDFIAKCIDDNFINNTDTFVNLDFLEIVVKTHTKKQISVSNVNNGIFNLHTFMTNCTQDYDIVYSFEISNKKLQITIEVKDLNKELIDVNLQPISNYSEVFETDFVSKVIVLTETDTYTLYLLNDRTTTTDMNNPNRVEGKTEVTYTTNFEDAEQTALNIMKGNSYNHNITFEYNDRLIPVGTPIAIKTKESLIYDTYISAIRITQDKFIEYTCGNIRVDFINKLLKERSN